MTTVAVLGATGNLGRAVVDRLAGTAWTVVPIPRSDRLTPTLERPVDVVVNCVGAGMDSMRSIATSDLLHANVVAAIGAARLAVDCGARFVHLGSAAEFAANGTRASTYVRTKRMASDALAMLAETEALVGFELFPHLVYGDPNPDARGVVAAMIRSMSSGEAFGLRTPHLRRDFVHRDDVARAVVAATETPTEAWETLEIGTGSGHSLSDAAEIIGGLLGMDEPWRLETSDGRIWSEDLVADPGPANRRLGFRSTIELRDGLHRLVRESVGGSLV